MPALELAERREFRLQGAKAGVAVTAISLGSWDRPPWPNNNSDKLLWTGDALGNVQSWRSSAADGKEIQIFMDV